MWRFRLRDNLRHAEAVGLVFFGEGCSLWDADACGKNFSVILRDV
jgi:hypothetical protein